MTLLENKYFLLLAFFRIYFDCVIETFSFEKRGRRRPLIASYLAPEGGGKKLEKEIKVCKCIQAEMLAYLTTLLGFPFSPMRRMWKILELVSLLSVFYTRWSHNGKLGKKFVRFAKPWIVIMNKSIIVVEDAAMKEFWGRMELGSWFLFHLETWRRSGLCWNLISKLLMKRHAVRGEENEEVRFELRTRPRATLRKWIN
jgi:hypothetical protein